MQPDDEALEPPTEERGQLAPPPRRPPTAVGAGTPPRPPRRPFGEITEPHHRPPAYYILRGLWVIGIELIRGAKKLALR